MMEPGIIPAWMPTALAVLVFICLAPLMSMRTPWVRASVAGLAILLAVRYAIWRTVDTVWPVPLDGTLQSTWVWLFWFAEMMLLVEGLVYLLMLSRRRDRHAEADDNQRWYHEQSPETLPSVDIFIATYNEEWDVLEKTVVGALALDYPNIIVHVLDDGARDWLRTSCEELGVNYIRRPDRAHAKAGNINHALSITHSDLVLVFDADFVAQRDFLQRTVGFFREERTGLVQVPHHFFNTDPVQANLGVFQKHADDQEFFFTDIMACRDGWGVAFSCGSNSLARRSALQAIGGIPTDSITEDILTSIVLLQRGWKTVYLNERLARGLAPEGLAAMYTQRARWARGGIQLLFLKNGPLTAPGLNFIQRLFFLPLSWVATNLCLPLMILAPLLFLWLGLIGVPSATGDDLLFHQVPMLLGMWGANRALATVHRNTIISLASSVFASFRLTPAVVHSLFRPFAVGFKVTPKGKLAQGMQVDARAVGISLSVMFGMVTGMVVNQLPSFERVPPDAFLTPSIFWGCCTVLVMFACLLMAFEFDRRRGEERFLIHETHEASCEGVRRRIGLEDVSITGAAIAWGIERPAVGTTITVHVSDVGDIPAVVTRWIGDVGIGARFEQEDPIVARVLMAKIFTHAYENHGKVVSGTADRLGIWRRLAGAPRRMQAPGWSVLPSREPADAPAPIVGLRPDLTMRPAAAYPRLMPAPESESSARPLRVA
ncbi:MAG TPA: glycosyltransferase [Gemmatimonas sp.]|uniref:glycosyltransferase n=1 Tax=Gemmatimonas sp. TaxID=1962908 RepID=UPI002ED7E93C